MRTCDEILELLSARLDGALSAAEEAELAEHLEGCAACRALSEDLAVLHEAMPALNVEPPPALLRGVMEQIRAETPAPIPFPDEAARARRRQRKWRTWGATAAVLAVVVLSAATLRMFGGGNGTASPASMAGGASVSESALSGERSAEAGAEPREQAMDGAVQESASPREPQLALRITGAEAPEDGALSAPPEPVPSAAPESALPGQAPMCVGLPVPLTETEALQLLYEEKFAEDYPDAAYTLSEGFEGYTLVPMAPVRGEAGRMAEVYLALRGQSENGAYYLFERFIQTIDASSGLIVDETVWNHYAVPLAGGDILSEEDDADAFASAVGE